LRWARVADATAPPSGTWLPPQAVSSSSRRPLPNVTCPTRPIARPSLGGTNLTRPPGDRSRAVVAASRPVPETGVVAGFEVRVARAYDVPGPDDGARVLWTGCVPRGLAKATAALDELVPARRAVRRAAPLVRPRSGPVRPVRRPVPGRNWPTPNGRPHWLPCGTSVAVETITLLTATKMLAVSHASVLAQVIPEGSGLVVSPPRRPGRDLCVGR